MLKKCLGCGETKETSEFHKDKSRKTGLRERCKTCRCKYDEEVLKKCVSCKKAFKVSGNSKAQKYCSAECQQYFLKYGISGSEYKKMQKEQNNRCWICGETETTKDSRTGKFYKLAVDHCHETGNVRGLLCNKCNNGLGCFMDKKELLSKAIDYLILFDTSSSEHRPEFKRKYRTKK